MSRRGLIIDTDPGVDDAFAIALATHSPHVELLGVTTVFGNVGLETTTANALRLLALFGREDVPVAAGADRPLVHPKPRSATHVHGSDGLSGRSDSLPRPERAADPRGALALLAELLAEAREPVTIAAIGPLTNIALLLAVHPWVKQKIDRLVIMGGGLSGGNVTPAAEFNIWSDPEAAHRVLTEEGLHCVLVTLDVTMQVTVGPAWLAALGERGPIGRELVALSTGYLDYYRETLGEDGFAMHDPLALAEAITPGTLGTTAFPLDVDCTFGPGRGALLTGGKGSAAHTVEVTTKVDPETLRTHLLDSVPV